MLAPGRRPQEELFAGPRSTGWKTQGVILKALLTVLMGGGDEGCPTRTSPLLHKDSSIYGCFVP